MPFGIWVLRLDRQRKTKQHGFGVVQFIGESL